MEIIIQPRQNHIIMESDTSEPTTKETSTPSPVMAKVPSFQSPRLRKWLKRALMQIAAGTVVAIVLVSAVYFFKTTSLPTPTVSLDDPLSETHINQTASLTAAELAAQLPVVDQYNVEPTPVTNTPPSNPIPVAESNPPSPNAAELAALIQQLTASLQRADDATLYLETRVGALENNLQEIKTVDRRLAELTEEVSSLKSQSRKLYSLIETSSSPPTQALAPETASLTVPPFTLIGIDRWHNEWNAVLEMQGKLVMLTPEAERAGWQLVKIEPTARKALFRNREGIDHELKITR